MQKFNKLKSIPAYLPIVNIDTDMIIPKQFLKTIKRTGLGKNLFFEMRYDGDSHLRALEYRERGADADTENKARPNFRSLW